jgi:predicted phage terminase large subunit-like protein
MAQRRASPRAASIKRDFRLTPPRTFRRSLLRAISAAWIQRYSKKPDLSGMQIVQSWDTAIKGTPDADYSVCTTWGQRDGHHYLLDVYRKKVNLPDLVEDAVQLHARYPVHAVLVEDQGSGSSLIAYLRKRHQIHAIERRPRDDKESRFARASLFFEKGQVSFPENAPWLADLERELMGFPGSKHDDQVDSVSQYINWVHERSGGTFSYDMMWDDPVPSPEYFRDIFNQIPRY